MALRLGPTGSRHVTLIDLLIAVALAAVVLVFLAALAERDDGTDARPVPDVNLSTEVLLDATTIELRGYGPDGEPGVFLYDCEHDGERLVCTQREEKGDG